MCEIPDHLFQLFNVIIIDKFLSDLWDCFMSPSTQSFTTLPMYYSLGGDPNDYDHQYAIIHCHIARTTVWMGPQWLWPPPCYHWLPHCMYYSLDGDPNDYDHQHAIIRYPTNVWQSGWGPQWLWPPECYHSQPHCMYYSLDGDPNDHDHQHAIIHYSIVCTTVRMGTLMTMTTSMLSFTTPLYVLQSRWWP